MVGAVRSIRKFLWIPAALLAASASAQITQKPAGYEFRAKYAKNGRQEFEFNTVVVPIGSKTAPKQNLIMPVAMRVLEVAKGGVAKIQSRVGPVTLNGTEIRPMTSITVQVDSLNRLVGQNKELPQFATPLPLKPVKSGGSWSATIDASEAAGERIKVKATYKLLRVQGRLAYIQVRLASINAPNSTVTSNGQGTMVLRTADCSLESMQMNQTVTLKGNRGGARTIILVRRRL